MASSSSFSCFTLPSGVEAHDSQFDFFGKRVAVASSDGVIRIFDAASTTSSPLCELSGHAGAVWQVRWSFPSFNGGLLVSCSYDRSVIVWRENSPNSWEKTFVYEAHELSVNSVCFGPHEHGLLVGCASSDGSVSLLRYQANEGQWNAQRFMAHHMGVNALVFAPSGCEESLPAMGASAVRFATGGCDNLIKIWRYDVITGDAVCEEVLKKQTGWVRTLAWTAFPGFKVGALASGSADRTVCVWRGSDIGKPFQLSVLPAFADEVWDLSWSHEGATGKRPTLAVTTGDSLTTFWQVPTADNTTPTGGSSVVWTKIDA